MRSKERRFVDPGVARLESPLRVALVSNVIAAYRVPELRWLGERVAALAIFVSRSNVEDNLATARNDGLDIRMVKSLSWRHALRHPAGYVAESRVFVPVGLFGRLRAFAPDAVISMELGARTLLCAMYRLAANQSRLIVHADLSERTEAGRGRLRTLLRRLLLGIADAVIVNGRSGASYVCRLGVDPAKVFAVPYSSNTAQFGTRPRSPCTAGRRRLIYVGRLMPGKGLMPFFRALADWCKSHATVEVEFVIVGGGELRDALAGEPVPANLKLVLAGPIAYALVPEFYLQVDIFVFPTLGDTWGLVVNEAMVSGLPVLGSEHSQAVQELVEDGRNGWRFVPEREQGMRAALARALATPEQELEEMGANARKRALALGPEAVAEGILKAVEFATRGPAPAEPATSGPARSRERE